MTYDVKKKADRFGDKQPAHAVDDDRIKEIKICVNSET